MINPAVTIIFPHQLFENNKAVEKGRVVYLVEEYLFFRQYSFHKQKIAFHRASMKFYQAWLNKQGIETIYINADDADADCRRLVITIAERGFKEINYTQVTDDWLEKRMQKSAAKSGIKLVQYQSPLFINTDDELGTYFSGREKFFQTDFYIAQRKYRNILISSQGNPAGNKWSFDADNRKPFRKNALPPVVTFPAANDFYKEAFQYVQTHFPGNYGQLSSTQLYPVTFNEARAWLNDFLETRFVNFGVYEDAIVHKANYLHHSVLTPVLNAGLLTPGEVIKTTLRFAENNHVPLNSVEGFIRQVLGWREFIRGVYQFAGVKQRTRNYWGFTRKIPASFWQGTTGIVPIDSTIKKVLATGYCHHIERLMILGNFFLLCEFDPNEVYRWFMELFIDAYDWVMVPNIYGMSQFADGGLMATKPYISGSNYLLKMSDLPKDAAWTTVWDALFWRFMHVHRNFFESNPRLGMLVKTFDKMPVDKRNALLNTAETFLATL